MVLYLSMSFCFNSYEIQFLPSRYFTICEDVWKCWIGPHLMLLSIVLTYEMSLCPTMLINLCLSILSTVQTLLVFYIKIITFKAFKPLFTSLSWLEHIYHKLQPAIDNFQQPFSSNEWMLLNFPAKRLFLVQISTLSTPWKTLFCAQWQLMMNCLWMAYDYPSKEHKWH